MKVDQVATIVDQATIITAVQTTTIVVQAVINSLLFKTSTNVTKEPTTAITMPSASIHMAASDAFANRATPAMASTARRPTSTSALPAATTAQLTQPARTLMAPIPATAIMATLVMGTLALRTILTSAPMVPITATSTPSVSTRTGASGVDVTLATRAMV